MSTPHVGARLAGALALLALFFVHAACARGIPLGGPAEANGHRPPPPAPRESAAPRFFAGATVYEVDVLEPGTVSTRPVPVDARDFQRALQRLAPGLRLHASPQEAARALLQAPPEPPDLGGTWEAEVYRDRVLTLMPLSEDGPLTPEAEANLRARYLQSCQRKGGGDCLGLFSDGPFLRADDRRTLALSLAFESVLDEAREALGHELSPQALITSLLWTVGMYLGLWLLPEPTTKALAASLTVILIAWLGLDTLWELMDAWARLATRAHSATTFDELRAAGLEFARVLGKDAARTLILAVATLSGRTLGELSTWVRSLPRYSLASLQFERQGMLLPLPQAVEAVEMVVVSNDKALSLLTRPQGPLSGAMLSRDASASAAPSPHGHSATTVLRHRGGNQQVELSNGQRWHLPRGQSPSGIPFSDPLGDELQAAATRIANKWSPRDLTRPEQQAIDEARKRGQHFQAARLEGQARGRWVEKQLKKEFGHLKWNSQGVDITGPQGQSYHYEVLSGTADNFGRHGRRMSDVFFRMIFF
jgi:hypothetical protein